MSTALCPYLSFKDNTRQAMEFYKSVFGGQLGLHTFKEYGASQSPDQDDKVMHGVLTADNGIMFMAADMAEASNGNAGFSIALTGDDEAELRGYFEKLAEGGNVIAPMAKQVWGDMFGMVTDKFGIRWMVNIAAPKTA